MRAEAGAEMSDLRSEWMHRMSTVPADVRASVAIDEIVRLANDRDTYRQRINEVLDLLDGQEDYADDTGPNLAMQVAIILKGRQA